jgi:prevent-host-death family protein
MANQTCGAEEARQNLPALLEAAHHGHTTIITRRGKPYAAIVPLSAVPAEEPRPSFLAMRGSAKGKGYWGPDPAAYIRDMRDAWDERQEALEKAWKK